MRLTVLVALLLVRGRLLPDAGFGPRHGRRRRDELRATGGGRNGAAGAQPGVGAVLAWYAAVTVRCDAEDACDGQAKLLAHRSGELLGTIEYFIKPGQPMRLMIPAGRPQRAILHWRARNGVESQTEISVIIRN